jgi:hypothetical protein
MVDRIDSPIRFAGYGFDKHLDTTFEVRTDPPRFKVFGGLEGSLTDWYLAINQDRLFVTRRSYSIAMLLAELGASFTAVTGLCAIFLGICMPSEHSKDMATNLYVIEKDPEEQKL